MMWINFFPLLNKEGLGRWIDTHPTICDNPIVAIPELDRGRLVPLA